MFFSFPFCVSNARLQESNVDYFEKQSYLQQNQVLLGHGMFAVVLF